MVSSPLDVTSLKLKGAFGYVHLATGKLPEPSTEPLETLLRRAERGEIRLAVVQEPLKGLPKIRPLRVLEKGITNGSAVTSPSTRTIGLVTAADLTGEGRPVEIVRGGLGQIRYFGARLEGLEASKIPLLVLWASLAGIGLALGIVALRKSRLVKAARSALAVATAGTLALLPAGLAPSATTQIAMFFFATLVIAALSRPEKRPTVVADILQLFGVLVVLDTVFGWGMVAHSALSGYYSSGIRFYGIGNEYMGLLIGAALMSVPKRFLGWVGLGITLLLGLPMLGANAGGAMAASVAFASGGIVARRNHKTSGSESEAARSESEAARKNSLVSHQIIKILLLLSIAILTAVFFAFIDRLQPGAAQSHIGQAAGKGTSAWGEIIVRKLAMNARLTVAGPTLLALAVVGVGMWHLKRLFARLGTELQGRVVQGLWGAGAAIAFNDSGTVAALLLLAPVIVTCLDKILVIPPPGGG
ncbi:hypothetical protein [Armatimonas sp.]|uniref:hypothetical protein n=1 Tax=Armatimonas sp. TaxID=1872638 RepID=UPI0037507440